MSFIGTILFGAFIILSASAADVEDRSPAKRIARAKALFADLEYDAVLPLTAEILAVEGLDPELKLEAYLLQAQAFVVVGQVSEAERPFRLLFRARPEFDLPAYAPPKILAVWRKVQVEERALQAQLNAVQRRRLIAGLTLEGGPIPEPVGGLPLPFRFQLGDPERAVEDLRVSYRKLGDRAFSQVPMNELRRGVWRGAIPGELTASDDGITLEYFVETRDQEGSLLTRGTGDQPLQLAVAAGSVPMPKPIPELAFWAAVGTTGVATMTAVTFSLLTFQTQDSFRRLAGSPDPIEGSHLLFLADQGQTYATATNVLLAAVGVLAVATILMFPFTSFADEDPLEVP